MDKTVPVAVMCGLATFIPLPWIDGWIERKLTGQVLTQVAGARSIVLQPAAAHALVEDKGSLILGCLWAVFIWPIKKAFRSFFFVLAVKDAVDVATRVLHRVRLVEHALERGLMTATSTQVVEAGTVRAAMDASFEAVPHSPVGRWLRRRAPAGPAATGAPVEVVGRTLGRWGGGHELDEHFVAELVRLSAPRVG